jgi:hypothetical protein
MREDFTRPAAWVEKEKMPNTALDTHVQHGYPFMTTGAAHPMAMNEPLTAVFQGIRSDGGETVADRAKPTAALIVVLREGSFGP